MFTNSIVITKDFNESYRQTFYSPESGNNKTFEDPFNSGLFEMLVEELFNSYSN